MAGNARCFVAPSGMSWTWSCHIDRRRAAEGPYRCTGLEACEPTLLPRADCKQPQRSTAGNQPPADWSSTGLAARFRRPVRRQSEEPPCRPPASPASPPPPSPPPRWPPRPRPPARCPSPAATGPPRRRPTVVTVDQGFDIGSAALGAGGAAGLLLLTAAGSAVIVRHHRRPGALELTSPGGARAVPARAPRRASSRPCDLRRRGHVRVGPEDVARVVGVLDRLQPRVASRARRCFCPSAGPMVKFRYVRGAAQRASPSGHPVELRPDRRARRGVHRDPQARTSRSRPRSSFVFAPCSAAGRATAPPSWRSSAEKAAPRPTRRWVVVDERVDRPRRRRGVEQPIPSPPFRRSAGRGPCAGG